MTESNLQGKTTMNTIAVMDETTEVEAVPFEKHEKDKKSANTDVVPNHTSSTSKKRIEELTILRAFAFLAIVLQHSIGEYIVREDINRTDSILISLLYHFTRFGTLTFVFISTVLLFYSRHSAAKYGTFLKRRAQGLLVPFALWTLIYCAFILQGDMFTLDGWTKILQQFVNPTYGYHLWFILMIFQLYLLFPWLLKIVHKVQTEIRAITLEKGMKLGKRWIVLLMIGIALLYLALMDWSYRIAPGWTSDASGGAAYILGHRTMFLGMYILYIAMGILCAYRLPEWRRWIQRVLPWSALVFGAAYLYSSYRLFAGGVEPVNVNISTYLKPSIAILAVSQMLLLYALALNIVKRQGMLYRCLKWIGSYSFPAYLVHALVLSGVALWTRTLMLEGQHFIVTILTWIAVAAGSLFLSKMMERMPYGKWLTGTGSKRKTQSSISSQEQHSGPEHVDQRDGSKPVF
ncbi:acyltransferase [Paenibacillus sp. SC116]|uniref:acyltransferase n=1 Tax=Paenibacillus sp. SC116 TaxID=2968986 RepID=UPI00215A93AC|nr:acyltransferase [Paenibacillus sp. SC116]MCR8846332.1 acyltransferase [Paenibacillus sp. SC116]